MKTPETERAAAVFVNAIRALNDSPAALDNLESYLSWCFTEWLEKYANTPEGIANELKNFSEMYERND